MSNLAIHRSRILCPRNNSKKSRYSHFSSLTDLAGIVSKFKSPDENPHISRLLVTIGTFIGGSQGVEEERVWEAIAKLIDKKLDSNIYSDCSLYTAEKAKTQFGRFMSVKCWMSLIDTSKSDDECLEKLRILSWVYKHKMINSEIDGKI